VPLYPASSDLDVLTSVRIRTEGEEDFEQDDTGALALVLFVAAPATAQRNAGTGQEKSDSPTIEVTGVIEEPEITTYMYGSHAIVDEASGERYALRSEEEGLLSDSNGRGPRSAARSCRATRTAPSRAALP
jgi:hypothetical protein